MSRTLLVIGGSGLVGNTLIESAQKYYDIHFTYNKNNFPINNIEGTYVDLTKDRTVITSLIKTLKPDITIHTAAHPNVDYCETDHVAADLLHVDITKDIATSCNVIGSKLIYISTDAVFPGEMHKKYTEIDPPNPINYYGKTKLQAEKIILGTSTDNVILRSAVIYGYHTRSRFTNWILETLSQNKIVDPYIDQYNTPTLVDDLTNALLQIIKLDIFGLYHATGKTCINRYDFALKLAEKFGLSKDLIKSVTAKEKKQIALRPISTCLDSTKLEKLISYDFKNIDDGIEFIYKKSKS